MAPVAIRGIRKSYGSVAVIHGVDIDIDDGDFVILVGPSGCGKSTLLRMVAGLEAVTHGEIRIGGRKVNAVRAKDRDVAMVFQNYALYPHMTVAENMGFALKLAGKPREEIMRRVSAAADILALTALLDRLPKQLSGGQRQRVAMGRAIVRDPQVFLFDEPLSNLDAKLRVQMRTEIKALHQRLGTTTIYVTHDQVEAMTMADKIVVMHDGVVEQMGTPLDLYDHPDNLFVASFIGSPAMNMVAGQIRGGRFVTDGNVELPHALDARSLEGRRAVYGIRPEHIELADEGMEATVVVVEPTGSESLVAITVAGQMLNCVFRERISTKPGDTLRIRFKGDRVHLFDQATGRRLGAPERKAGIVGFPKESDGGSRVAASIAPAQVRPRFLDTLRSAFKRPDPYRPELHYMRGPSPRSLAARSNTPGEQG